MTRCTESAPVYDYNQPATHPDNMAAAKALSWEFDSDFGDHRDREGHLVHDIWHTPHKQACNSIR